MSRHRGIVRRPDFCILKAVPHNGSEPTQYTDGGVLGTRPFARERKVFLWPSRRRLNAFPTTSVTPRHMREPVRSLACSSLPLCSGSPTSGRLRARSATVFSIILGVFPGIFFVAVTPGEDHARTTVLLAPQAAALSTRAAHTDCSFSSCQASRGISTDDVRAVRFPQGASSPT